MATTATPPNNIFPDKHDLFGGVFTTNLEETMRPFFLSLVLMCALLSAATAQNENTERFFLGNIYSKDANGNDIRHPYLTVLMARDNAPDKIIAAAMSDPCGELSFYGTPINTEYAYKFTVLLPNGKHRVFRFDGIKKATFKGNCTIHMRIEGDMPDYYKLIEVPLPENPPKAPFMEFIAQQSKTKLDASRMNLSNDNGSMLIFLNYRKINIGSKAKRAIKMLAPEHIQTLQVVELIDPNDYYAGAISVLLKAGNTEVNISNTNFSLKEITTNR